MLFTCVIPWTHHITPPPPLQTEFYQQVRWKQVEQKKKAMLF
ncbi:hypothetical protein EON64_08865 [archaeon]|nr:MAG: hypothetical protein EON64_08865 [archaeon]